VGRAIARRAGVRALWTVAGTRSGRRCHRRRYSRSGRRGHRRRYRLRGCVVCHDEREARQQQLGESVRGPPHFCRHSILSSPRTSANPRIYEFHIITVPQ
jgi:hypothetical protein